MFSHSLALSTARLRGMNKPRRRGLGDLRRPKSSFSGGGACPARALRAGDRQNGDSCKTWDGRRIHSSSAVPVPVPHRDPNAPRARCAATPPKTRRSPPSHPPAMRPTFPRVRALPPIRDALDLRCTFVDRPVYPPPVPPPFASRSPGPGPTDPLPGRWHSERAAPARRRAARLDLVPRPAADAVESHPRASWSGEQRPLNGARSARRAREGRWWCQWDPCAPLAHRNAPPPQCPQSTKNRPTKDKALGSASLHATRPPTSSTVSQPPWPPHTSPTGRIPIDCTNQCSRLPAQPTPIPNTPDPTPHTQPPIPNLPYPTPHTQYPIPNSPYPTPDAQLPIPNPPYPAPHTQYPIPNSPYPTPHAQLPIPNPPYPTPHTQPPVPNSPYPIPRTQLPASNSLHPTPGPQQQHVPKRGIRYSDHTERGRHLFRVHNRRMTPPEIPRLYAAAWFMPHHVVPAGWLHTRRNWSAPADDGSHTADGGPYGRRTSAFM